jgi:hypothetical protein
MCVYIEVYKYILFFSNTYLYKSVSALFLLTTDVREDSKTCYEMYSILLPVAVVFFDAIPMLIQDF